MSILAFVATCIFIAAGNLFEATPGKL